MDKAYKEEISQAIQEGKYRFKLLPFTKRHSCEIILPKAWEGKKVMIVVFD